MKRVDDAALAAGRFGEPDFRDAAEGAPLEPGVIAPLARIEEAAARAGAGVGPLGLRLTPDADLDAIAPHLGAFALVVAPFANFSDGRGFSQARRLREFGFSARLRAEGRILSDQWAYARRVGFDEAVIPDELAARHPIETWRAAASRPEWFPRRAARPGPTAAQ